MVRIPQADFDRIIKMAKQRRIKRLEKRSILAQDKFSQPGMCPDTQESTAGILGPVSAKKPKKARSASISVLEKRLWDTCSAYIRLRDKWANDGKCFYCGVRPIECAMHRIKRGKRATKYDERNLDGGCSRCNFMDGPGNQSQQFDAIFIRKKGSDLFLALEEKSRETCPRTKAGILELTEHFKSLIANFQIKGVSECKP